jgi:alpha-L-fucosidase 2
VKHFITIFLSLGLLAGHVHAAAPSAPAQGAVDWPVFMAKQDMRFTKVPRGWSEAPHFGNGSVGSMLYLTDKTATSLKLQVFRSDVQDHRDESYGWAAYSRPRLGIGHFELHTVGKITGCDWRKDLWNAELTGTLTTEKGEIKIRHFTHAEDDAIVTELTPSAGEKDCHWTWHPLPAKTTRKGGPAKLAQNPNPEGRMEKRGETSVWIQDFLAGGQYATAWTERENQGTQTHLVSIAHTHPASTAADKTFADIVRFQKADAKVWSETHRDWWHRYYQQSFVSLPDPKLEALYWQTIYRFGAMTRSGRFYVDTPGMWAQGGSWNYTTADWNIQAAHWPVYTANRLDQGAALLEYFTKYRENLIKAVRPAEWQADSAYLPTVVSGDLMGSRDGFPAYFNCMGNLTWTIANFWKQYRYSMDETLLREQVFPLLRRSTNMYLHLLEKGPDGKLHLPPTYSPEAGTFKDANYDLALLKWGCHILLKSTAILKINDPLIPRWKDVIANTIDFPADERGFMLGSEKPASRDHRHLSHLLMIYPLYLVNIEQPGRKDVLEKSHAAADAVGGLPAMVQSHAAPIAANIGNSKLALRGLQRLKNNLLPNGMWYPASPCLESSLGAANIVQEMLLQSWSDPTKDDLGPIRVFPACPDEWKDVTFHDLRTEGALLVSAGRKGGATQWVRIKSLAGEPCRVRPGLTGDLQLKSQRTIKFKTVAPGVYDLDLKKGEEVTLTGK